MVIDKVLSRFGLSRAAIEPRREDAQTRTLSRDLNQEGFNRTMALADKGFRDIERVETREVWAVNEQNSQGHQERQEVHAKTEIKTSLIERGLSAFGFSSIRRKQAGPRAPSITVRYVTPGAASWMSRDYASYAQNAYAMNSDVYACVSLISSAAKQTKIEDAGQAKASADLLKKAGGPTFVEYWISYLLLSGNAYIEISRDINGGQKPRSVYLLSPDRVTAMTNINEPGATDTRRPQVTMWKVRDVKGHFYPVLPADMIHSKLFNPLNPIYGMSPVEAALLDIDAQNEAATLMKRTMQSGFTPGWIEAAENSDWSDTQVAQLKERLQRSRQGGEALFLQSAKWHEIGFKPVDAEIASQQTFTKRDIASVFHVPPQLIGDTQSQTYSNYQEARKALYMEAVNPLVKQFLADWNSAIAVPPPGGSSRPGYNDSPLTFDRDSLDAIAAARSEATERVHKLWTCGLITQNEARRDLEYDPVSGGDVFYAPANFLPLQGSEAEPQ